MAKEHATEEKAEVQMDRDNLLAERNKLIVELMGRSAEVDSLEDEAAQTAERHRFAQEGAEAELGRQADKLQELSSKCEGLEASRSALATGLSAAKEQTEAFMAKAESQQMELQHAKEEKARLAAENEALRAEMERKLEEEDAAKQTAASAAVVGSAPLMLGIEAEEDKSAQGVIPEVTPIILVRAGTRQAFRLGRVRLSGVGAGADHDVPVCAKVTMVNDGKVPWPETTAVVLQAGNALGVPMLPLGTVAPGESAEVIMDLLLPPKDLKASPRQEPGAIASTSWAVADAATGNALGPLLIFETTWEAE
jgi:hypothetical protein